MYLSRITWEGSPKEIANWNPYRHHEMVWKFFPLDPKAKRRWMFRYDLDRGRPRYFLVSLEPPQPVAKWRVETKPYTPDLCNGDLLHFDLRVNPVVSRREGKRVKRFDVVMDYKYQLDKEAREKLDQNELIYRLGCEWLARRASSHGFEIGARRTLVACYRPSVFHKRKHPDPMTVTTMDLTGTLRVTEVDAFRNMLFNGLGPAKSFGCGLMLVRRA
ncbi:type I-E CRISPR-associated protein Cas6/Cse3/CasE [Sulfidibacter corallicola]|uniref:Type I-E CRISPR-associated protein Cas6/Cse3/CasE n=1 Tax=Sulfidibacter corallicola TaxID=2818388 RepID=A0A8A4TJH2_SULCO|nr:type I-E CRISPR-associated protein Cas6/Cse3/CasE [Sulfidibacter corallicola]QTD49302.1 type I-E CRISPR-associated protein Cas6/Cse3/CasE [Sulfidibacter corallicola]